MNEYKINRIFDKILRDTEVRLNRTIVNNSSNSRYGHVWYNMIRDEIKNNYNQIVIHFENGNVMSALAIGANMRGQDELHVTIMFEGMYNEWQVLNENTNVSVKRIFGLEYDIDNPDAYYYGVTGMCVVDLRGNKYNVTKAEISANSSEIMGELALIFAERLNVNRETAFDIINDTKMRDMARVIQKRRK